MSILDSAQSSSSVLAHAVQLQNLAARIGFDWPSVEPVFAKLVEEMAELQAEVNASSSAERLLDELGDILFVVANLARHLKIDPEVALQHANQKFIRRFQAMEQRLNQDYPHQRVHNLELMDAIWSEVKQKERCQ